MIRHAFLILAITMIMGAILYLNHRVKIQERSDNACDFILAKGYDHMDFDHIARLDRTTTVLCIEGPFSGHIGEVQP
jgi:hypothetical protein